MIGIALALFQMYHWNRYVNIAGESVQSYITVSEAMKPLNPGRKYVLYLLTCAICKKNPHIADVIWQEYHKRNL